MPKSILPSSQRAKFRGGPIDGREYPFTAAAEIKSILRIHGLRKVMVYKRYTRRANVHYYRYLYTKKEVYNGKTT